MYRYAIALLCLAGVFTDVVEAQKTGADRLTVPAGAVLTFHLQTRLNPDNPNERSSGCSDHVLWLCRHRQNLTCRRRSSDPLRRPLCLVERKWPPELFVLPIARLVPLVPSCRLATNKIDSRKDCLAMKCRAAGTKIVD